MPDRSIDVRLNLVSGSKEATKDMQTLAQDAAKATANLKALNAEQQRLKQSAGGMGSGQQYGMGGMSQVHMEGAEILRRRAQEQQAQWQAQAQQARPLAPPPLPQVYINPRDQKQYDADSREGKLLAQQEEQMRLRMAKRRLGMLPEQQQSPTIVDPRTGQEHGRGTIAGDLLAKAQAKQQRQQEAQRLGFGEDPTLVEDKAVGAGGVRGSRTIWGQIGKFAGPEATMALGTVYVAAKVLTSVITTVAKAVEHFGDSTMTAAQAARKTLEELPLVGSIAAAMNSFEAAIVGKTRAIKDTARYEAADTSERAADLHAYQQSLPILHQQATLDARAKAFDPSQGGPAYVGFNAPSRDTYAGEVAYGQYERRHPLEMDQRNKQAELQAATEAAAAATTERQQQAKDLTSRVKIRQNEEFEAKYFTPSSGAGGDRDKIWAAQHMKSALDEELKARQQLIMAEQQEMTAVQAMEKAKSDLNKANINLMKDELAVTKEKIAESSKIATAFGGQSAVDKQATLEAALAFKAKGGGIDAYNQLTPEAKQALQAGGFGSQLGFFAQQAGFADPKMKMAAEALGVDIGDLKELQAKERKLQTDIGFAVQFDETKLAQAMKDVLTPIFENLVKQFGAIAENMKAKVTTGQAQANAAQ